MYLEIGIAVVVLIGSYFLYKKLYTEHLNHPSDAKRKYVDINIVRKGFIYTGILSAIIIAFINMAIIYADQKEEATYLENYVSIYDQMTYPDEITNTIYTDYNLYFGGMYLDDGKTVLLIREDLPQSGIDYLISNDANYRFVKFNYHELLSTRIQVEKVLYQSQGFSAIGIDDINNQVFVELIVGTSIPKGIQEFIDLGILRVEFINNYPVLT